MKLFLLNSLPSLRSKILDYTLSPTLSTDSSIVFSPTTATPIIFEVKESNGLRSLITYSVAKESTDLSSKTSSLFLLSNLNGCFDYTGASETSFINNGPDFGSEKVFGVLFPISNKDGSNYVKTVAYTPTQSNYYLKNLSKNLIYSPTATSGTTQDIILSGVPTMKSNYSMETQTVDSLERIVKGVEAGSICVASFGSRELFFWPEEEIFNEKYVGKEFSDKYNSLMNTCIKQ